MINNILFYFSILLFIYILPTWNYQLETCCLNEKTNNNNNNTTRLLTCPLNFVIKLRSVIFYTGNGCARSTCQKRFNKHYLPCNNRRTCSISIQCILMDSAACPWLTKANSYSQHLIVDYDCILLNNQTKKEHDENIVLFSAKVNIESPPELFNDSLINEHDEYEWKEYFFKKYFQDKQLNNNNEQKPIIIEEKRSLFSDIIRTIIILIIFAFILIFLMIISLCIYKHIRSMKKRKLYDQEKHQPFPSDEAYDNLKTTTNIETASESGTTTDV